MGLFSRWRRRSRSGEGSAGNPGGGGRGGRVGLDAEHLTGFAASRVGVEAYVEPATNVTPTTLLLIAQDGEWTRRRAPDPAAAWALARRIGVPVYDVNQTGYPSRMREYTARRRRAERGD